MDPGSQRLANLFLTDQLGQALLRRTAALLGPAGSSLGVLQQKVLFRPDDSSVPLQEYRRC